MEIDKQIDPSILKDTTISVESQEFRHDFSEQELIDLKDEYFHTNKYRHRREDSLSRIKEAFNKDFAMGEIIEVLNVIKKQDLGETGIKQLSKNARSTLDKINRGYELVYKNVYALPYYEIGRMVYYHEDGSYAYDRPMKPEERQTDIVTEMRKIS